jgi:hypothetical protein
MRRRRFRFTIGQLIKLIAVSAVLFAVTRTPFWPLALAIGVVLAGFAIDRTKGGWCLVDASLAGAIEFAVLGFAIYFSHSLLIEWRTLDLGELLIVIFVGGVVGTVFVMVAGYWALTMVKLLGRLARTLVDLLGGLDRGRLLRDELLGPIVWLRFEDRGLQHSKAGGLST